MLGVRLSGERKPNGAVRERAADRGQSNAEWMARAGITDGVILLGGSDLASFRIRVAQSHARSDLLPSFWSLVGLLDTPDHFLSAPLGTADVSAVPSRNGIARCAISDFDDPARYPNVALIRFTENTGPVLENAERVQRQRSVVDIPTLIVAWLEFVWGAGAARNPLLEGKGLPSAAFVEAAYGLSGVELTPGLSSASSCPEAVWQAAKWWSGFYEQTAATPLDPDVAGMVPEGYYVIRQPAAAVAEDGGGTPATRYPD